MSVFGAARTSSALRWPPDSAVTRSCLVAVDHDFAFAVVKALIQANRLQAPLTLRAITLDCFRVHDEAPREDAAHGVWGLLQSLSREYPKESGVAQVDLRGEDVASGDAAMDHATRWRRADPDVARDTRGSRLSAGAVSGTVNGARRHLRSGAAEPTWWSVARAE